MVDGNLLGSAGFEKLGAPYSEMDCQAFVEWCLAQCGLKMNLPGSNAWYREVLKNGWAGSPEECVKQFGKVPAGAFLFIWKNDGKEPEKYRQDGLGNASHIGLVTGKGEGAIHSSSSRGCVAESRFAGKTIRGGWNRVGLWTAQVRYDVTAMDPTVPDPAEPETETAVVRAGQGSTVNTRQGPGTHYALSKAGRLPVGTVVEILKRAGGWCRIRYTDPDGAVWYCWMKEEFLVTDSVSDPEEEPEETYSVIISGLDLTQAKALQIRYPDCKVEKGVG